MTSNSTESVFYGFLFGIAPGLLLGAVGLSLGGEWAWNLGFIALWLIVIGLFAGPALGNIGPEIIGERPTVSGAIIGTIPGIVAFAFQWGDNGWVWVLGMLGGSVMGAVVGHLMARHSPKPTTPTGLAGPVH